MRTISAPSLMVRNNSDARINVGTQVPIQSTSFTGNTNTVFGSTQFLNTGVILSVTPRVNPGGLVYLTVSQESRRRASVRRRKATRRSTREPSRPKWRSSPARPSCSAG